MLKIAGKDFTCYANNHNTLTRQVGEVWGTMLLYTREKLAAVNKVLNSQAATPELLLLQEALTRVLENAQNNADKYQHQLRKWLDSADYIGNDKSSSQLFFGADGTVTQQRIYSQWHEAAMALDGWVQEALCRWDEKKLAQSVYQNPYLDMLLNCLVFKLDIKLNEVAQADDGLLYPLTMELLSGQTIIRTTRGKKTLQPATPFGRYHNLLNKGHTPGTLTASEVKYHTPMEILKAPHKYSISDKVVLLHDMSDYLGEHQPWGPQTAGQWLIGSETADDCKVTTGMIEGQMKRDCVAALSGLESGQKADQKGRQLRGGGLNASSRDETAASTLFARKYQLALWSGHSMTVVRMLNTARWANADKAEMTALAQGLMAFWRLSHKPHYPFSYHTLHETMDMAKNFGVNYTIDPNRVGFDSIVIDTIDAAYLSKYIKDSAQHIQSLLRDAKYSWQALMTVNADSQEDNQQMAHWGDKIAEKQQLTDRLQQAITVHARIDSDAKTQLREALQQLLEIGQYARTLQYQLIINKGQF